MGGRLHKTGTARSRTCRPPLISTSTLLASAAASTSCVTPTCSHAGTDGQMALWAGAGAGAQTCAGALSPSHALTGN